jgi:hypothetical protein
MGNEDGLGDNWKSFGMVGGAVAAVLALAAYVFRKREPQGNQWIGNPKVNPKIYHDPRCDMGKRVGRHRVFFDSAADAEAQGFELCKWCAAGNFACIPGIYPEPNVVQSSKDAV